MSKIEEGDIKSFMLITGMEILGKVKKIENGYYDIEKAYGIHASQIEKRIHIELAPITPFAMNESSDGAVNVQLYFTTILLSIDPPVQLIEQYARQTGSIFVPPRNSQIQNSH
jgi:hypothetical protein